MVFPTHFSVTCKNAHLQASSRYPKHVRISVQQTFALKGYVIIKIIRRCRCGWRCCWPWCLFSRGLLCGKGRGTANTAVQHLQVVGDDFRRVAILSILPLPLLCLKTNSKWLDAINSTSSRNRTGITTKTAVKTMCSINIPKSSLGNCVPLMICIKALVTTCASRCNLVRTGFGTISIKNTTMLRGQVAQCASNQSNWCFFTARLTVIRPTPKCSAIFCMLYAPVRYASAMARSRSGNCSAESASDHAIRRRWHSGFSRNG